MIEFSNLRHINARKDHKCDLCGSTIKKGNLYTRYCGKYDGEFFDLCYHDSCEKIIEKCMRDTGENEYDDTSVLEFVQEEYCHKECPCCDETSELYDACAYNVFECPDVINWVKDGG